MNFGWEALPPVDHCSSDVTSVTGRGTAPSEKFKPLSRQGEGFGVREALHASPVHRDVRLRASARTRARLAAIIIIVVVIILTIWP